MLKEIVYRGMSAGPAIEDALHQVTDRLERQVSRFDSVSAVLRIVFASHPRRSRYDVSARLTMRGGILHARVEREDPVIALKRAFDDLRHQVERHVSHARREHARSRADIPPVLQPEEAAALAAREMEALSGLDLPQIARLQRFIRREAFYRLLDGRFPRGVSPDSVVDETVILALEEADERPLDVPYEVWLFKLAQRALDRRSGEIPSAGPEDRHVEWEAYEAGVLAPPTDDEWLEYFQPDEDPSVGDVTEDRTALSPEASYAGRELMDHVHRILGQLPRSWRHALTLYTVEGFELAEVAASLEAPADVVLDRIAMATRFLRDKLEEGGYSRPRRLASPDRPVLR